MISIKHNATASPLLALPAEIRRMIFFEILGGHLIHIQRLPLPAGKYFLDEAEKQRRLRESSLGHMVCLHPNFEGDKYQKFKQGTPLRLWPIWPHCAETGHILCRRHSNASLPRSMQLDLRILRACRQTYLECNLPLWSTNLFSFDEPSVFATFVNARVPLHITLWRRLRISVGSLDSWEQVLSMQCIRSLKGLKYLHIECPDSDSTWFNSLLEANFPDEYTYSILKFRVLPLIKASVIIGNWSRGQRSDFTSGFGDSSVNDRRKAAAHMERLLMDSEVQKISGSKASISSKSLLSP